MSGVSEILADRNKAPKSAGTPTATKNATKQQTAELVRDLEATGTIPQNGPPATPARGRGRPRSDSGPKTPPSRSKSPRAAAANIELPDFPRPQEEGDGNAKAAANRLRCRKMIGKLRAYHRNFPELLAMELNHINPHLLTYEELTELVDSCRDVIKDEVESLATGNIVAELIDGIETAALQYASSSDNESVQRLSLLRNLKNAAVNDPAIALDMKLIACEFSGFMPNSPYLRIGINLARVACTVIKENASAAINNEVASQRRFSDL